MDDKKIDMLEELTLNLHLDLNVLNSALKTDDDLEICALSHFVERIYNDSSSIRNLFIS